MVYYYKCPIRLFVDEREDNLIYIQALFHSKYDVYVFLI